jgi:hypothetical protein
LGNKFHHHHHHQQRPQLCKSHTVSLFKQMRILGDPKLRLQYDDIRHERLDSVSRNKQQSLEHPQSRTVSPTQAVVGALDVSNKPRFVTPEHHPASKGNVSPFPYASETDDDFDDDDTRLDSPTVDQTYEEEQTFMSEASNRSEGTLTIHQPGTKGVFGRVKDEVFGAMEDTATSFAQVLNAFTLQEEDIMAVTKRINKAARQMQTSL